LVYTNKKFFFADKIFLPYYCNFDKDFLIENDINFEKKKSIHLLIKFLNLKKIKKKFSYIQHPIFSKWVDRSSALSKHILLKNTVLFCTRLSNKGKREYNKNSTKLAKFISIDVLNYLNEYNFTNTQKINIKFKFYEYETSYRDNEKLKKLKKFTNRRNLNLVDTSEFMKYIGKNLSDLKKLKNYVKKSR